MSIQLEPGLETKLSEAAARLGKSADELADEAIRLHLEELEAQTLAAEEAAYQKLYPDLLHRFLHQYVAVHAGQMVDADPEFEPLFLRVQAQLGDRVVLIRRVEASPQDEYTFRSPRMEYPDESSSL